jgi:REP element-mobilizing transposase RayT
MHERIDGMGTFHNRRSIRLRGFDYSRDGSYFVTICTYRFNPLFGKKEHSTIELNAFGIIAFDCWADIPSHFPTVRLDEFVIMPDHIHGILLIDNARVGTRHAVSYTGYPHPGPYPFHGNAKNSATRRQVQFRQLSDHTNQLLQNGFMNCQATGIYVYGNRGITKWLFVTIDRLNAYGDTFKIIQPGRTRHAVSYRVDNVKYP